MDRSTINWRDTIDTAEGRDEMIIANWQLFASAAWAGYLKEGRGALLLDLKSAPNTVTHPGVTVGYTYFSLDSLSAVPESDFEPSGFGECLDRLRNYDPRREIVLFIVSADGDVLRTRCCHSESAELLAPPEAYRAETNSGRNNPQLS